MKKFYTLIAAAATVIGASALPTVVSNPHFMVSNANDVTAVGAGAEFAPAKAVAVAPTGTYNVVGEGTVSEDFLWNINSELTEIEAAAPGTTWAVTIEQSATDPAWYRTVIYNENSPMVEIMGEADNSYFYFNVADPNKVYSTEFNMAGTYRVFQKNEESGVGNLLANPTGFFQTGQLYGKFENGLLTFPPSSFYYLDMDAGRFKVIDQLGAFRIAMPGVEMPAFFYEYNNVEFSDGMLGSIFYFTREDGTKLEGPFASNITIKEVISNPGMFLLEKPWFEWFESGQPLVVNCTDPQIGFIDDQNTGVNVSTYGPATIASLSNWYPTYAELQAEYGAKVALYNITLTETGNGRKVDIGQGACIYNFPTMPAGGNPDPKSFYSFGDVDTNKPSTFTVPELAGVEGVVVEDNVAGEREFFNLQGVRVANPEAGLYIMRQGNKVQKVIIR